MRQDASTPESLLREALQQKASAGADATQFRALHPVWLAWRRGGRLLSGHWAEAGDLSEILQASRQRLAPGVLPDALELCLTSNWQREIASSLESIFPNRTRGLRGIEIRHGAQALRLAPTTIIASNRAPLTELNRLALAAGLSPRDFALAAEISSFAADQFLILPAEGRCQRLWRGGTVAPPQAVSPGLLHETIRDLSDWMRHNLNPDGRMTYKYWPSRGREAQSNNTIRQFMATVALGRIAARSMRGDDLTGARANLAYNMKRFYQNHQGLGTVVYDGKGKLGAMALAALAILEFRDTGLIDPLAWEEEYQSLIAGIYHLWQADGSFVTFLLPEGRNDQQNFYPGEALLFLTSLHRQTRDPLLARMCLTSFHYYRDWHRANPNPAFVPWHSQAWVMFYEDLGAPEDLAEFVFERNDWLLPMQQWGGKLSPDFYGRFYNPARPDFGPPHASSTGVYMEGLADAWRLARQKGDIRREARYAEALRRGLRAIRQLQFRDRAIDAFYISRPEKVMGGLRTETYNNEIRVDNVQHCLMALLKLADEPDFLWHPPAP